MSSNSGHTIPLRKATEPITKKENRRKYFDVMLPLRITKKIRILFGCFIKLLMARIFAHFWMLFFQAHVLLGPS